MNWLKRLLHLEEPKPVEKPEPEPPVLELCPICGRRPKPKYVVRDITLDRHYYLEKAVWQLSEWCDHAAIISSFAPLFEDEDVQKWNTGCRRLKAVVDEPVPECPACGEKPVVQTDSESDIPPACLLMQRTVGQRWDNQRLSAQTRVDTSLRGVETQAGQRE